MKSWNQFYNAVQDKTIEIINDRNINTSQVMFCNVMGTVMRDILIQDGIIKIDDGQIKLNKNNNK